jgi:hypothetical protein
MTSQIVRKIERLEALLAPQDQVRFRIEVVFINAATGRVTGTRIFSSEKTGSSDIESRNEEAKDL